MTYAYTRPGLGAAKVYAASGIGTRLTGTWYAQEITPRGERGPLLRTRRSLAQPVGGGPSFPRSTLFTRKIGPEGAFGPLRPYGGMGTDLPRPLGPHQVQPPPGWERLEALRSGVRSVVPQWTAATVITCFITNAVPGISPPETHWVFRYAALLGAAAAAAFGYWKKGGKTDKALLGYAAGGYVAGAAIPCALLTLLPRT